MLYSLILGWVNSHAGRKTYLWDEAPELMWISRASLVSWSHASLYMLIAWPSTSQGFPRAVCFDSVKSFNPHMDYIYFLLMHRCFRPWREIVFWVPAEFLSANVILLKVRPVTVSGTASDKYSSTTLLRNVPQTERKRKIIFLNDDSPLASPL